MKKTLTLLIQIAFSTFSMAQGFALYDASFTTVTNTTLTVNISPSTTVNTPLSIRNNGSSTKSVKVVRTIYSVAGTDATSFNWASMAESSGTNVSSFSQNITAGQTLTYALGGFQATLIAGTATSIRQVHYRFYDVANPSDSVGVTLKYMPPVGIDEKANFVSLNSYPNPASDVLFLNYAIENNFRSAKLIVYDLLGKKMKEIDVFGKQGIAKLAVDDLNAGVYFYSFIVDNVLLATRKIIIEGK